MPAEEAPVTTPGAPPGLVRRLLARGLVRAGIVTYLFSGLTLVANLVTGVVMARTLGPEGRGVAFALVTGVTQLAGLLFADGGHSEPELLHRAKSTRRSQLCSPRGWSCSCR